MSLVGLDLAKQQCRITHSLQDDLIEAYTDQAEAMCAEFLDANVYADQDTLNTATAAALGVLTTANDAYNAAMDTALDMDSGPVQEAAIFAANKTFQAAQKQYERTCCGLVLFPAFTGAVLLLVAHFYTHPEAVADMTVNELPLGFQNLLFPYRRRLGV